jgi:hypothetical protein
MYNNYYPTKKSTSDPSLIQIHTVSDIQKYIYSYPHTVLSAPFQIRQTKKSGCGIEEGIIILMISKCVLHIPSETDSQPMWTSSHHPLLSTVKGRGWATWQKRPAHYYTQDLPERGELLFFVPTALTNRY